MAFPRLLSILANKLNPSGTLTTAGGGTGRTDGVAVNVSGTVATANGGTGLTSPGASGNVLVSDGANWTSGSAAPTTAQVLSATAGASVGDVGTYAFLSIPTTLTTSFTQGNTYAGSSLRYSGGQSAGGNRPNISGTAPAGTWRAMGFGGYRSGCCVTAFYGTLFLRVS